MWANCEAGADEFHTQTRTVNPRNDLLTQTAVFYLFGMIASRVFCSFAHPVSVWSLIAKGRGQCQSYTF